MDELLFYKTKTFGLERVIDERSKGIHDENGKRNTLWIGTPQTYNDRNEAYTDAKNDFPAEVHWGTDHVRCHKNGSQHQSTRKEMKTRFYIMLWITEMKDSCHDKNR